MARSPSSDLSDLSTAASDVPKHRTASTAPTSVEVTQEEAASLTAISKPTLRGRKRGAEDSTAPVKRARRSAKGSQPKYTEETEEEEGGEAVVTTPKTRGRAKRTSKTDVDAEEVDVDIGIKAGVEATDNGTPAKPKKRVKKTKTIVEEGGKTEEQEGENGTAAKKVKRKRKTKEEKEAEAMPLSSRTIGSKLFVGAHVSGAGGELSAVRTCSCKISREQTNTEHMLRLVLL